MCAEAVWWRCHRRIIADYLLATGFVVSHVMGHGKVVPAKFTSGIRTLRDGTLTYPAIENGLATTRYEPSTAMDSQRLASRSSNNLGNRSQFENSE